MTEPQLGATAARRWRLGLLARAGADELDRAIAALPAQPEATDLRGPETGLVMLTGRIGGDGGRFNLGEVTVSRSTVRLAGGEIGFGQLLGGDQSQARQAAILDAVAQTEAGAPVVSALCRRVEASLADAHRALEAETAATRVDFFTLVRGED